jgi:hypothetical protein
MAGADEVGQISMSLQVTMHHVRAVSLSGQRVLCAHGIRTWCERHDIDLRMFLKEGLPIEQFEQIDDAFAQRLVALVRAEAKDG